MVNKKAFLLYLGFLVFILYSLNSVIATPFIIGFVNDSFDGELANGHTILLWKESLGIQVNLTDIIGPLGNSGTDNFYMIDCGLIEGLCEIGDIVNLKVINEGDDYVTKNINVSITGAGFEAAENLRINSKPFVNLVFPLNFANVSGQMEFNCSAFDMDGNLAYIDFYSNFSGGWVLNESKIVNGYNDSKLFIKNFSDGRYLWGCSVRDDLDIVSSSLENRTINFDNVYPIIESININQSYVCEANNYVRVNCTTYDAFTGVREVFISSNFEGNRTNHSTTYLGNNVYYSDIFIDELGEWSFVCISFDYSQNTNTLFSSILSVLEEVVDLVVSYLDIIFSKENPIEEEVILLNVSVSNVGCADAENVLVGFYEDNPLFSGIQISQNQTGNIPKVSSSNFYVNWTSKIGRTQIYVVADVNNSFIEPNENDNMANRSIDVVSWHMFYGNITADRILATFSMENLGVWLNDTNSGGNVYVTDTESQISWSDLLAFGKNKSGGNSYNDFANLDNYLGSSYYEDSISNFFTTDGFSPKNTTSFTVNNKIVSDVPFYNTTLDYNFITGILWDSADDTDGAFGGSEKEDVVFLTKIKRNSMGSFGTYDYEIIVPSKLREYDSFDSEEVFIYFDLN